MRNKFSLIKKLNKQKILLFSIILLIILFILYKIEFSNKYTIYLFSDEKIRYNDYSSDPLSRKIIISKLQIDKNLVNLKHKNIYTIPFHSLAFSQEEIHVDRETTKLNLVLYDKKQSKFYIGNDFFNSEKANSNSRFKVIVLKKLFFNKIKTIKECCFEVVQMILVDISRNNDFLFTNNGEQLNLENCSYKSSHITKDPKEIIGAAITDKTRYYYMASKTIYKENIMSGKYDAIHKNANYAFNYIYGYSFVPMVKSPDEKTIAYLDYNSHIEGKDMFNSRISFIDVNTSTIKRGAVYRSHNDQCYIFPIIKPVLVWSNKKEKPLIALFDYIIRYEKDGNSKISSNVIIYNVKNDSIILSLNQFNHVKSLRWSPDDKKLGILALEPTKNTSEPAATKGVLYIYDLDTKKLTKLMDCPDCFDFHFVE